MAQILPMFDSAEQKNKLLRTVAGGGVEQISNLQGRWDKFEIMMESFQLMVKEQVRLARTHAVRVHTQYCKICNEVANLPVSF